MTRCAIYTRKSSDEGLEQNFNSLDAQREACEAYVLSQAGEGWSALPTHYDDGGFSGGSMERPGLKRLLADISRGLVDVVVVYKIDRLTRSLADFARIVEQLDARDASFVSVTQAFNTTTSMGRLTLNVLLSFAQFEREVTGERISDKIAASKAKGLWMGGLPPFGYDVPTNGTRVLQVNEAEAATVRHIFDRYLALRSVHRLVEELKREGIRSKERVNRKGETTGAQPFGRGALFHLLKNRVYVGEIVHKGESYPGQHEGIVDPEVFERVQALLARQLKKRKTRTKATSPLAGKLFDVHGNRLTPTHTKNRHGRTYRYYVASRLQQGTATGSHLKRFPAARVDALIAGALARISTTSEPAFDLIVRTSLSENSIELVLPSRLLTNIRSKLAAGEHVCTDEDNADLIRWTIPAVLRPRGGRANMQPIGANVPNRDPVLINALRRAHRLLQRDSAGLPIIKSLPPSRYDFRVMRLALLSPRIQREILAGRQPLILCLEDLMREDLPASWAHQERLFKKDFEPTRHSV
jgi:DNA invertase Pin-like site-specific DNA recombinase